ncbi:type I restriction enzyme S subunit [Serratia fonticola]|uniref:Type I restriction enzyme S subunit n=1 Tax=Serratia fonticola TaxID=47917 RepID=A0A542D8K2_SERFO|nr:restriction endonuclease subunit S [Serratia fonticola]TQI78581.1 type I restriction enzyme S subunit [Serratia fonticola]TQI99396.1 type I restriction enzyme S subunit [Serratia fonticola]TVZ68921.1 type I restriction enzyme S subunit [Serratia fonticola]
MNEMSYLEKLLDGVDVEWKSLGKVASLRRGRVMSKGYLIDNIGKYPVYSSQTANNGIIGSIDTFDFDGEYISWTTDGANAGTVFYRTGKFSITNVCGLIKINEEVVVNYKYLFYWLTIEAKKHVYSGMGNPKLMSHQVEKIPVPIPCPDNPEKSLAIQSEIVRILDTFTVLTAELTAELNMRKKQYNYYRDQLLSFDDGEVEWKTLGDVTKKWYSGGTPTAGKAEYYENGDIPWLRTQEVKFSDINSTEIKITQAALKNSAAKWIPENCVIIAISGATAGRSAINKIPLATNQHCGCLEIDDTKALYRYVFHWVSFNYENIKLLGQGARGDLNSTIIKNFKLPVPYATDPDKSLEEQARIVDILDKFDTLTNSITEGLPREIELRQKQYKHYRELLFSFPRPEVAEA